MQFEREDDLCGYEVGDQTPNCTQPRSVFISIIWAANYLINMGKTCN